ncbi:hypothetical protein HHI36_014621, partial [Cryptolaemus montrouzieri]
MEKIIIAAKSVAKICLKKAGIEEEKLNQEKGFPEDKFSIGRRHFVEAWIKLIAGRFNSD